MARPTNDRGVAEPGGDHSLCWRGNGTGTEDCRSLLDRGEQES